MNAEARYEPEGCIIVIFGASGDLTGRKLAPAVYNLAREDLLPPNTVLVGYGRTEMSDEQFRERLEQDVGRHSRVQPLEEEVWRELAGRIFYQQGAYAEREDHAALKQRLEELDEEHGTAGNRTFYLAVPPEVVEPILDNLSAVGALRRQASCPEGH
ncbi:MAG: glucose-6-phosphate dehydrogenase, partial [Candidatus Brocadiia bacterium]